MAPADQLNDLPTLGVPPPGGIDEALLSASVITRSHEDATGDDMKFGSQSTINMQRKQMECEEKAERLGMMAQIESTQPTECGSSEDGKLENAVPKAMA